MPILTYSSCKAHTVVTVSKSSTVLSSGSCCVKKALLVYRCRYLSTFLRSLQSCRSTYLPTCPSICLGHHPLESHVSKLRLLTATFCMSRMNCMCVCAGTTAGLVSKYRPPVPILTLVVPTLQCKDRLAWTLQGRSVARVCLIQRGILPVLAAPSPSGKIPAADSASAPQASAAFEAM